jgi:hypothetical protein
MRKAPGPTKPKNQPVMEGGPYPTPRANNVADIVAKRETTESASVTDATAGMLAPAEPAPTESPDGSKKPSSPLEQREPAVVISAVVGVGISLLALAGISLTQDQIDAFEIVIGVLLPILSTLVAGIATRSRVTPSGAAKLRSGTGDITR